MCMFLLSLKFFIDLKAKFTTSLTLQALLTNLVNSGLVLSNYLLSVNKALSGND